MKLRLGAATLAKKGNRPDENEDAYAPQPTGALRAVPFRCAIADGATEASYSALWAKLLVEHFCSLEEPMLFDEEIPILRETWRAATHVVQLPWYAEQKLAYGAFATLLGVCITESKYPHLRWQAVAIGDSVLFHVRACEIVATFPMMDSKDFESRPLLLATGNLEREQDRKELYHWSEGILEAGDRLYLATDKIAQWIVRGLEKGTKPFIHLDQVLRTEGSFAAFVEHLIHQNELRNDDYTLLWVEALDEVA